MQTKLGSLAPHLSAGRRSAALDSRPQPSPEPAHQLRTGPRCSLEVSLPLQGRPAGGRLRRPSSAGNCRMPDQLLTGRRTHHTTRPAELNNEFSQMKVTRHRGHYLRIRLPQVSSNSENSNINNISSGALPAMVVRGLLTRAETIRLASAVGDRPRAVMI